MIKNPFLKAVCLLVLAASCSSINVSKPQNIDYETYHSLASCFQDPPQKYGTSAWWTWMNGNVSKEGIAQELQAMKDRGFQGASIYDMGGFNQRGNGNIEPGPMFGSEEWNSNLLFALDEAERLGLEIGFTIMSGWNLGGPGIAPEYAVKCLTSSEVVVNGGKLNLKLELPASNKAYYRDIAVLAFPRKCETEGISDLPYKLGTKELGGSATDCRFLLFNAVGQYAPKPSWRASVGDILNISRYMKEDGTLECTLPEGEWAVIRIGYTCTNSAISTCSDTWGGNVIDHMSSEAFDFYWDTTIQPILNAAGHHVGKTLKGMETDSWEGGGMNWTPGFEKSFKSFMGYDIIPYLAVLNGYVIEDESATNAFLADFRKTIAYLMETKHYARFAERAHENGMIIYPESAGPHAGIFDGMKNYGHSDIVMSEFWSPSPHRPKDFTRFFLKQASSVAHTYGKHIVGAESFTTIGPHWNDLIWKNQKSAFDHEICAGLNRVCFHTFTSSPTSAGLPGNQYFAGTHIDNRLPWWDMSSGFMDYLRRTQMMVQNGKFTADVLYYYGDHIPNIFPYKHSNLAGAMPGFDYDACDEYILLSTDFRNGRITVPGGITYRVLVLPARNVLSLAALKQVKKLVSKGAVIISEKPECSVSLKGGFRAKKRFQAIAGKLWGDEQSDKGEHQFGKGKTVWGVTAREYLLSTGLEQDFSIVEDPKLEGFDFIHYQLDGREMYFITNQSDKPYDINCRFRTDDSIPEFWDALDGSIRKATEFSSTDGITTLPLHFDPYGALIIVFNESCPKEIEVNDAPNFKEHHPIQTIDGPWTVHFDPTWGGPETCTFAELTDWSQSPLDGIRYYSGHATYVKDFDFNPTNGNYYIELGDVLDTGMARIKLNGTDLGIVWTKPFRAEISSQIKEGSNHLEITVANSWFNRVAGDQLHPDRKQYTKTNIRFGYDYRGRVAPIELSPSGLIGPVIITD